MADRASDPKTVAAIRELFYSMLDRNKPVKSYVMEKSTYNSYIATLTSSHHALPIGPKRKFSNRKRFKVLYKDHFPYLVRSNSNKRVYHREEIFDAIFDAHCSCDHGDGRRTYAIVKEFADNIFLWECLLVTKLCYCKRTKGRNSKMRNTSSPESKAGDIHLISMEKNPDKDFQWLLLYRDANTKFLFARPLRSSDRDEIVLELLYLFLNHGAPLYFNTSLSKSFAQKLLKDLYALWPECPTVFGLQLVIDVNDSAFMRDLAKWMKESKSSSWSIGAALVTYALNAQESTTLGCAPYALMHRTRLGSHTMNSHHPDCDKESSVSNECLTSNGDRDDDDFLVEQDRILDERVRILDEQERAPVDRQEELPKDDEPVEDISFMQPNTSSNWSANEQEQGISYLQINPDENQTGNASTRFPISESDSVAEEELVAFFAETKIVDNAAGGDCMFFAVRQHFKAFTQFEYRVDTLRHMVAEYFLGTQLGKDFLVQFHPDVYPHSLEKNTGRRESWGGPETPFAVSQVFNIHVTILSFIRPSAGPYLSKFWPVYEAPPPRHSLSAPSAKHLVMKFEKEHYTLLLPKELQYPPKRFKRDRGRSG